jgi:hypothetical protein
VNDHSFEVSPHVLGCNPDGFNILSARPLIPPQVCFSPTFEVVSKAVDFNGYSCRFAPEVESERTARMLLSKV